MNLQNLRQVSIEKLGGKMNAHRNVIILMRSMVGAMLWWSLMIVAPQAASATVLSDLAASMQPGAWAELQTNGFSQTLLDAGTGHHILEYSDKGTWSSSLKQFNFIGQGHSSALKHIRYSDSTNTWTNLGAPSWFSGIGHGYQHNAIDSANGIFYYREYNSRTIQRFNIGSNSWTALSANSLLQYVQVAGAIEYFPEMNALIMVSGAEVGTNGAVFKHTGSSWTRIGGVGAYPMGIYHNVAVYSPMHQIVVFGGGSGSTNLYKLTSAGVVSPIASAPVGLDMTATIFTVDPSTGNYLLFADGSRFYEYNVASNTWTQKSATSAPIFVNGDVFGVIAAPVRDYGVIMFVKFDFGNSKVYLYKHAAGGGSPPPPPTGDTTAPSTPGNLSASAVSASQINMSWSASTDNVGVTGYKLFRNGTQVGTSTGTTYQDTGLSPSTTYVYTVQANDAAGNNSSQSTGDSATTQAASTGGGTDFQSKCQAAGVINCFGVDSSNQLYYNWPAGTACASALGSHPNGNNPFGLSRSGNGNAVAHVENGQCVFPAIDTTVKHSGAGSLKFTIGTHTGSDSAGYYTEPLKRLGGGAFSYVGPGSPLGNVIYFQFYQRFDPNFANTNYLCTGGGCGGWKQMIWYGNPPNGSSSGLLEVTHNNGWQRGVPQMYGQQGHDDYGIQNAAGCAYAGSGYASRSSYPEPPCVRYKADQWMEFTGRIELRGSSNAATSRVQLWVDGKLVIDYGQAKICWTCGEGEGIGSFLASPYHTNKDSGQDHPTGFTWMDDIIVSTQPIAMTNSSVPNPPPTAPTNLRVQ